MVNKIKETALKVWNIVNGKDKNLDGKVDIKDAMLAAQQKAKKKTGEVNELQIIRSGSCLWY